MNSTAALQVNLHGQPQGRVVGQSRASLPARPDAGGDPGSPRSAGRALSGMSAAREMLCPQAMAVRRMLLTCCYGAARFSLGLATVSADQISFRCWRPGSAASEAADTFWRPRWAGRTGAPGMSLWASDSNCWRGVARACVPGGRRDSPGVSREGDATAVTLGDLPPSSRGRLLRAERRLGAAGIRASQPVRPVRISRFWTPWMCALMLPAGGCAVGAGWSPGWAWCSDCAARPPCVAGNVLS